MEEKKINSKVCTRCKQLKSLDEFNKGNGKYKRRSICRECEHEIQNTPERVARRRELELLRRKNPDYVKKTNERDKRKRLSNPKHWLWVAAKYRAKKKNLEFTISESDIDLPEKCPLLNIPMWKNPEEACANSYSIDRINPNKGYTKDNIWVISKRANALKSDATLEELELLVTNLRKKLNR